MPLFVLVLVFQQLLIQRTVVPKSAGKALTEIWDPLKDPERSKLKVDAYFSSMCGAEWPVTRIANLLGFPAITVTLMLREKKVCWNRLAAVTKTRQQRKKAPPDWACLDPAGLLMLRGFSNESLQEQRIVLALLSQASKLSNHVECKCEGCQGFRLLNYARFFLCLEL